MDAVPSVFHQYFLLIVKLLKQDDIESCFAVSLMSPNSKFDTRKKMALKKNGIKVLFFDGVQENRLLSF